MTITCPACNKEVQDVDSEDWDDYHRDCYTKTHCENCGETYDEYELSTNDGKCDSCQADS